MILTELFLTTFSIILGVQFKVNVGLSILASLLAFIFAFLAIQCGAVTDVTPLTAAAKASQLVFGGVTAGSGGTIQSKQTINLIAGAVASAGADMGASLVTLITSTKYLLTWTQVNL